MNPIHRPENNEKQIQAALKIAAEFAHGLYQHYKGGLYSTHSVAIEEATLQAVVVYQSHENGALWTRPWVEFTRLVEFQGRQVPRFRRLGESEQVNPDDKRG